MRTMLLAAGAVAWVGTAAAQEAPKPGPEHEGLKKMVGTWDATMKMAGMETKATAKYTMEMGGLWLVSSMEGELFGAKFTGKGLDGYDPAKKKFVSIWVDSMGTAPVLMEGNYDEAKKTLTMTGEGPGMDGKPAKYRSVTEMPDDDTMKMTMYIGSGSEPAFTLTSKRRK
jgi:hypothetical protein